MNREQILSMPAGKKMNQFIWWMIFDMKPTPPNNDMDFLPDYSGDMSVAWLVVKKFPELHMEHSEKNDFAMIGDDFDTAVTCETMPLAICRSALLARGLTPREPDSLKAGVLSLPAVVKSESNLPA